MKKINNKAMTDQLNHKEITKKQVEAIKQQAIALWGDKWLPELVRGYERVTEAKERTKFAQIQRYFKLEATPNLESMNAMLIAVNCEFQLACFSMKIQKF